MPFISFVGLGPVGFRTAVCFATKGYKVIASEIDTAKANQIEGGNGSHLLYISLQNSIKKSH